jgi:uncharacterized repeat protein (TIGR01451 family)
MKVLNQFKCYIFIVLFLAISHGMNATHGTSGSITYRCVDTNIGRYEITLNVVRQCVGVSLGNESIQINSSRFTGTIAMGTPTIKEITPVCKVPDVSVPVVTNCPSGPITNISGSEKWIYKTTVVLGKNLGWALIGWGTCCRQGTLSTISGAGGQGIWIQAAINTNVINSSPIFNSDATNFVCFNKENWFDLSAKDSFDPRYIVIDGNYIERDSLVYELYAPFTAQAANINNSINLQNPSVTYISGYSANSFFISSPPMNFNKNTGVLRFTPTVMGESQTGIVVKEYRAIPSSNGKTYTRQLVGHIARDQTFTMNYCEEMNIGGVIADSSNVEFVVTPNLVRTCRAKGNKIMMRFTMPNNTSLKVKDVSIINSSEISNYSFKSSVKLTGNTSTALAEFKFDRNFATKGYEFKVKVYYCNALGISIENYIPLSVQFSNASIRFENDTLLYCHNSGAVPLSLPLAKKVNWTSNDAIISSANTDSNLVSILPLNSHWIRATNLKTPELCRVHDSIYVKVETCNRISGNIVHDMNNNCTKEDAIDVPAKIAVNLKGTNSSYNQTLYTDNSGNFTFTPPAFNNYVLTVNNSMVNCNPLVSKYNLFLQDTQINLSIPIKDSATFIATAISPKKIRRCINDASIDLSLAYLKSTGFLMAKFDYGEGTIEEIPLGIEEKETSLNKTYQYKRNGTFAPSLKIVRFNGDILFQTSFDTVVINSCLETSLFIDMNDNCSFEDNVDMLHSNSNIELKDIILNEISSKTTTQGSAIFYAKNGANYTITSEEVLGCNQDKKSMDFNFPNNDTVLIFNLPIDKNKIKPSIDAYFIFSNSVGYCLNTLRNYSITLTKSLGVLSMSLKYSNGGDTIINLPFASGTYRYNLNHNFINHYEGSIIADFLFNQSSIKQVISPVFKHLNCMDILVFNDKNKNCIDNDEMVIKNFRFTLTNLATNNIQSVISNSQGILKLKLDNGVGYRINSPNLKYRMCSESYKMEFLADSNLSNRLKIPLQYVNNYRPHLVFPNEAFNNTSDVILKLNILEDINNRTDSILDSHCVYELTLPENCYFKGVNIDSGVSATNLEGRKYIITSPRNVAPQVTVYFRNIIAADIFCFHLRLRRVNIERDTFDNVINRCRRANVAYDPNNKIPVIKSSISEEDFIDKTNQIHYTINFQNEGQAPARDVYILDQLSARLNWETMEVRDASHPMSVSMTNDGLVRFDFKEIILPEKAIDEEGSKGFVRFTIYPKEDLQIGEEIRNTAGIYFDLNDPVITNTAISRLVKPTDKYGFYNISADVYPANSGLTEGQGRYLFYDPVKIKAIPKPGYDFEYWVENGVVQGAQAEHFFTAKKDKRYTAYFIKKSSSSIANVDVRFNISPNPASDKISIEVPTNLKAYSVRILTVEGRYITEYTNPKEISVISLPRGLYFIELRSEGVNKVEKLELR